MQNIALLEKAPGRSTQRTVGYTVVEATTASRLSLHCRLESLDETLTNGGMKKG